MQSKRRDLKILWSSNAPWANSGYGVFMGNILPRLVKDGWKVALSAFAGLSGSMIDYKGYPVYPVLADTFGGDAIVYHGRHFQANVVMTMQDVWTLQPPFLQQLRDAKIPFIPYVPVDQSPVPPQVLDRLRYAYKVLSFSKFGQTELQKSGFSSTMIYEGVDTQIFKPMDRKVVRDKFKFPQDKFIVGMIGANKENPSRKGWQEALEAFKLFSEKHDSIFFFQSNQNVPSGFPILDYAKHLGILDKVLRIDEYMALIHTGPNVIAEMINACDIIIHPSATEGFGLLPVEAMACEVPVIVNNSTSQPEMVIDGITGLICNAGRQFFSPAQGYWRFADVTSLHEKMEQMFLLDRVKMGKAGRAHVLKNFDIDKIVKEQWIPFYEKLQDELLPVVDNNNTK